MKLPPSGRYCTRPNCGKERYQRFALCRRHREIAERSRLGLSTREATAALEAIIDEVMTADTPRCACGLSLPCNDCVPSVQEFGGARSGGWLDLMGEPA